MKELLEQVKIFPYLDTLLINYQIKYSSYYRLGIITQCAKGFVKPRAYAGEAYEGPRSMTHAVENEFHFY